MYDIIIRNGTVIDPISDTFDIRDIYIKNGRIVNSSSESDGLTKKEIDASGCYVTPGLIDSHIHLFNGGSQLGGKADIVCPATGVTTAIDAGSAGIYNFPSFYEQCIMPSTTSIKATISPSKGGVQMDPYEEITDPVFGTYDLIMPLYEKYSDALVGIKQRVHKGVTREFGLKSLEQSAKTARRIRENGFPCRLMVHFGPLAQDVSMEEIMNILEPGDVFTHIYRPDNGTTIFDDSGKVLDCIKAAQRRGVVFESGCARSHCSFVSINKAFADSFPPEIISTDMIGDTFYWKPSGWLPLKMSIYLNMGMELADVVKAVTFTPASVYGILKEAGTLSEGNPADVAIFRVEDRDFHLDDLYGGSFDGNHLIVPMATVKAGKIVFQQIYL